MTKTERVANSTGNPSKIGHYFCVVLEKMEFWQGKLMEKIADFKVGKSDIDCYQKLHGFGTRPQKWWNIANLKPLVYGHTPQPGGWFYSAGIYFFGYLFSYGCGWGDPGTWSIKKQKKDSISKK